MSDAERMVTNIFNAPAKITKKVDAFVKQYLPPRLVLLLSTILVTIGGLLWFYKFINDFQCLTVVLIGIMAVRVLGFDYEAEETQQPAAGGDKTD